MAASHLCVFLAAAPPNSPTRRILLLQEKVESQSSSDAPSILDASIAFSTFHGNFLPTNNLKIYWLVLRVIDCTTSAQ
jgi:hypothetical protein